MSKQQKKHYDNVINSCSSCNGSNIRMFLSHAVLFSDFSLVYILVESYLQLDTCHAHAAARVSSTDSELLLFSGTIA